MQRISHLLVCVCLALSAVAQDRKPAVLFSSPGEMRYAAIGFDYLRRLHAAGFEVDYTEGAAELTPDRLKDFNVLVVLSFPATDKDDGQWLFAPNPPFAAEYLAVVNGFIEAGGGVLLHITSSGMEYSPTEFMRRNWGLELPLAIIADPTGRPMTNLPHIECGYTQNVLPSPVSDGVKALWYPLGQHYVGGVTMPVIGDRNWTPVVRIGPNAYTHPPTFDRGSIVPREGTPMPADNIPNATLFAVRELPGGGRLAASQVWHQFTIGSGMKWLFAGNVLDKGIDSLPSDWARLLENTYRWLAAPSLAKGQLGGFVTDAQRLLEPQLRDSALDNYKDPVWTPEAIAKAMPGPAGPVLRGLVGAETGLSGGSGTVAEFAAAARVAKLDFVIFLEEFAKLTPEKLTTLTEQCKAATTDDFLAMPGYKMQTNIGNHIFMYAPAPEWPPERMLVGPDKTVLNLQFQDEKGEWAHGNPALNWVLYAWTGSRDGNVGYYKFTQSGQGMRMSDLRPYSAAAVRTYEDGKLVEDMTDEYLTTCQSFAVPSPMSMNIVRSPAALTAAVTANQALTYTRPGGRHRLIQGGLRWNHSYDGLNVFMSDGPIIHSWPGNARICNFGAERFVTGRSLDIAPLHVTSEAGLKELRIYNGQHLWRRFVCNGAKEFNQKLLLTGVVQRSLVLVAEDVNGGQAVSFAHRSFKDASLCPVFCSDHVNDCGHMLLAHGPHWPMIGITPTMPTYIAGNTWDGGAGLAQRTLLPLHFTHPWIRTDKGQAFSNPYQTPLLESSDEGFTRCRMIGGRRLAPEFLRSWTNAWSGFGPIEEDPFADLWASHAYFGQYSKGVEPMGYGSPGIMAGPITGLFTEEFTWKQDMTLHDVQLWMAGWRGNDNARSRLLVIGAADGTIRDVLDASVSQERPERRRLQTGDWFAVFSAQPGNTALVINRGDPLRVGLNQPRAYWMDLWTEYHNTPVKTGDTYRAELMSVVWPMDEALTTASQLADVVRWFTDPTGMEVRRGTRGPRLGGLFEVLPADGAVELFLPQETRFSATLPVRVNELNRRWTAGLWQQDGYRLHTYNKGNDGWRELGLDLDGRAYVPLYASIAKQTHVVIGHPVVADDRGTELFIQVTRLADGDDATPPRWHVSVNNPTDAPVTTRLHAAMALPGLTVPAIDLTFTPGEYRVLSEL